MQEMHSVITSDGTKLAYTKAGDSGPVIVLLHGWSGSSNYWSLNTPSLAEHNRVVALDLRFHGRSDMPDFGHHVHKLAKDLYDVLEVLCLQDVTVVGASMGASIIWAYIELFGHARFKHAVFVDQAPLQNNAEDWTLGSKGCYDAASLARLQTMLHYDFPAVAKGNTQSCLSKQLAGDLLETLQQETLMADPQALGRLMADHTQLDWRPLLAHISLPCLNLVGGDGGCFHPAGVQAVTQAIPGCQEVVFEGCNHWLYMEEPERFNSLVSHFAATGQIS